MKRNKKIILILIVGIVIISMVLITQYNQNKNFEKNTNNYLSIMIQNEEENYEKTNDVPTEGYEINSTESHCEKGSELSLNNGKISVKGNKSDKCYVVLDIKNIGSVCKGQTAQCLAENYSIDPTLIYHDGTINVGGQIVDAADYSYRYSGASANVHNYVCFGGECSNDPTNENYSNLYRIIGIFPTTETKDSDKKTYQLKIIKADYATEKELGGEEVGAYGGKYNFGLEYYQGDKSYYSTIAGYYWNSETNDNDWSKSNLNKINLNEYYLNTYLGNGETKADENPNKWQKMIENHTWTTEGNTYDKIGKQNAKTAYTNEITSPSKGNYEAATTVQTKVGLMYVSDYMYGATKENWTIAANSYNSVSTNNWLYMGLGEWIITRRADIFNDAFHFNSNGTVISNCVSNFKFGVRPVIYLNSSVKITSGSGTSSDPYIIS